MTKTPDSVRLSVVDNHLHPDIETEVIYARYLERARQTNLDDITKLNVIYRSGIDAEGRTIFVAVGKNLPDNEQALEKVLLYVIRTMDSISNNHFILGNKEIIFTED